MKGKILSKEGSMFYWTYLNWMEDSGIQLNEQGKQSRNRRNTKELVLLIGIGHKEEMYLMDMYQETCI